MYNLFVIPVSQKIHLTAQIVIVHIVSPYAMRATTQMTFSRCQMSVTLAHFILTIIKLKHDALTIGQLVLDDQLFQRYNRSKN